MTWRGTSSESPRASVRKWSDRCPTRVEVRLVPPAWPGSWRACKPGWFQGRESAPGRPSDASWVRHPKVPMSEATRRRLSLLAERASDGGRKVSPMQIAAQILEDALAGMEP